MTELKATQRLKSDVCHGAYQFPQTQTFASFRSTRREASSCDHAHALWTMEHGLPQDWKCPRRKAKVAPSSSTCHLQTADSILPGNAHRTAQYGGD